MEVKQALRDGRFRDSLPLDMREDIAKYLQNPGCACNVPLYRRILKEAGKQLIEYYPGREPMDEAEEIAQLAENHWQVINCSITELESRLAKLPPGRKQITVARYQDQVTVIVNELELLF